MNPLITWPFCIAYTAGMDCAWNALAMPGFSSTLTLVSTTWPPVASTAFSMTGLSVRHGPHHGAHRSMMTGTVADFCSTSASKVASVTSIAMRSR